MACSCLCFVCASCLRPALALRSILVYARAWHLLATVCACMCVCVCKRLCLYRECLRWLHACGPLSFYAGQSMYLCVCMHVCMHACMQCTAQRGWVTSVRFSGERVSCVRLNGGGSAVHPSTAGGSPAYGSTWVTNVRLNRERVTSVRLNGGRLTSVQLAGHQCMTQREECHQRRAQRGAGPLCRLKAG